MEAVCRCQNHLQSTQRNKSEAACYVQAGLPDGKCIFIPKIPVSVYFWGPRNEKVWYILWPFEIFLEHFMSVWKSIEDIWYISPVFGKLYQ
jgi:hypothetical protein